MSTEAVATPTKVKKDKKHKKEKSGKHDSNKKRKREEDNEQQPIIPDSQPKTKKHKKDKKQQQEATPSSSTANSPFISQTSSLYIPLSPCAYNFPLDGLCAEHISPLLLTYYPPLEGVLLSYNNPRMSEHPTDSVQADANSDVKTVLSRSVDEYAVTYVWLTAEFLLFRPKKGTKLEGYVSLQNEGMVGLVCYNYFNASIVREKLPEGWRWVEDEDGGGVEGASGKMKKRQNLFAEGRGHFVDGEGKPVEGSLAFTVEDYEVAGSAESGGATISILGTLLRDGEGT